DLSAAYPVPYSAYSGASPASYSDAVSSEYSGASPVAYSAYSAGQPSSFNTNLFGSNSGFVSQQKAATPKAIHGSYGTPQYLGSQTIPINK
ncbi:hypothetical protein, partial [Raoultella ornithinolytica]|uniref:hypothetical protein n=1 Tax=Raoultella ornithinolytica TaxID=54291 RepID=UPI001D02387C